MARPKKQTVDYFPHQCNHGKTMFILEQKYGNDGYAFWFKLLEILGVSEGHCFLVENVADWEFLQAKTHIEQDKCIEILNLLANLEAIDKELWNEHQAIWSDNFLKNVADAYKNRKVDLPTKPEFLQVETSDNPSFYGQKPQQNDVSTPKKPQTKVDETKVNKSILIPPIVPLKNSYAEYVTMTNDEYEKLLTTYGKEMTDRLIEILDNYKGANGKKYKSDYRAILNWVVKGYQEEQAKPRGPDKPKNNKYNNVYL